MLHDAALDLGEFVQITAISQALNSVCSELHSGSKTLIVTFLLLEIKLIER